LEGSGSSSISEPSNSQCTKQPCQTKDKHYPCDTDEQSDSSFFVHLFTGTCKWVSRVLDEDPDHHDKDDSIENQDDKDGAQKGSKEYCGIRDEATMEGEVRTKVIH